jgi:hypothetical protein
MSDKMRAATRLDGVNLNFGKIKNQKKKDNKKKSKKRKNKRRKS